MKPVTSNCVLRFTPPDEETAKALRLVHRWMYPRWPDPYEAFDQFNTLYFGGFLPTLPIQRALMPYGKCVGLTQWGDASGVVPRITMGLYKVNQAPAYHDRVLLHEMLHAYLALRGESPSHNEPPWCREIVRVSRLMGYDIQAEPVRPRRINGVVVRRPRDGYLKRTDIALWPHTLTEAQRAVTGNISAPLELELQPA